MNASEMIKEWEHLTIADLTTILKEVGIAYPRSAKKEVYQGLVGALAADIVKTYLTSQQLEDGQETLEPTDQTETITKLTLEIDERDARIVILETALKEVTEDRDIIREGWQALIDAGGKSAIEPVETEPEIDFTPQGNGKYLVNLRVKPLQGISQRTRADIVVTAQKALHEVTLMQLEALRGDNYIEVTLG